MVGYGFIKMSKYRIQVEHIPVLGPEEVLTLSAMSLKLEALPIKWDKVKLTDNNFFCPSFEGCHKAIEYLMPKIPKHYVDKFDCENFAGWLRHKVAEIFHVNNFAEVEGYADLEDGRGMQRHSWTVFTEGEFFYQLETQNCVIMDIDDPKYAPDEIVMG